MKRTMLLLLLVASCASAARLDRQPESSWCLPYSLPGPNRPPEPAWVALPENAATIVRPENIRSLLPGLERDGLVEITRTRAEQLAGPLPAFDGGHYYLTRGGVVGGPAVTVEEYLRNASSRITVRASIDPNGGVLLVETFQLSATVNYRNVAVIVWSPTRVRSVWVGCHSAV